MMKKRIAGVIFGLFLLIPEMVFAHGTIKDSDCQGERSIEKCHEERHHHTMDKQWQEKMKQKQQQLLALVSQYTPEKKKEWEAVMKERNDIMQKWLSPKYAEKRKQWKKEKMAKFEALHKQYKEGKITKDEFIQKLHANKGMGHWKIYHELKQAVKNHDDKKTAQLLNQLLTQVKKQNKSMKAAMKN